MPGLTFTAPPHPGLLEKQTLKSVESSRSVPGHERDPHVQPFTTTSDAKIDEEPILYLPPLLSSLPQSHNQFHDDILLHTDGHAPFHTETHLPDIDPVSLSLHKALHRFRPIDNAYASRPYEEAFNWDEMEMPKEEEREWYVVAFRSRRRDGSDGSPLYSADKLAHEEAVQNGGLIMYWYGVPDPETGLNLATCIWQSRGHAVAANSRPQHVRAAKLAKESFEVYQLERYVLRKAKGKAAVEIEEWQGGDVGW